MQQPVRIAGRRFQRVAKRVPQIEQRPITLLGLIAQHNLGFHLDGALDRVEPRLFIACRQCRSMCLKPLKECRIPQQPVLHHLAIAREKIPAW